MNASGLVARITRSLRAGGRALAVLTDEEQRAIELLERVGEEIAWPVHVWSPARGVDHSGPSSLEDALRKLLARKSEELWVLLDPRAALDDPINHRLLRDLAQRTGGPATIVVTPRVDAGLDIPELVIERLDLPDIDELREQVVWIGEQLEGGGHEHASERMSAASGRLARAALGLARHVVDRLIAEAVLEVGLDEARMETWLTAHKPAVLDPSGLLEHVTATPMAELGGVQGYKSWLEVRRGALDPAARAAGIPEPRGALLIGVQGCGKSLAARATAHELGLPLLRLEPGRLFGGTVGESEHNLQRTLGIVDRMAPAVLWLDEVDKGLAGSEGAAADAGTTARVVGGLLTWLQERSRPVFVVATANDVSRLPPELLRRGRLDELFFFDLPDADERAAILTVHLLTRPARELGEAPPLEGEPEVFAQVAREADGYSGAELESALVDARLRAFQESRPVSVADLILALEATIPLSRSHAEHIDRLRAWAGSRARSASTS